MKLGRFEVRTAAVLFTVAVLFALSAFVPGIRDFGGRTGLFGQAVAGFNQRKACEKNLVIDQ